MSHLADEPFAIEVEHLVKQYHSAKEPAVRDVSFKVEQGALFALLGPNGAGKTTTLSVLNTTLSKTSGEVKVAGFDVESQSSQVRQNIGVIFQNPSLDINLTAEENLRVYAGLYGLYTYWPTYALMAKEYKHMVAEFVSLIGLEEEVYKPVKTFSGGMKRKLEIIRSLMHQPKILFLDEPTTGLDPLTRNQLWEYLREKVIKERNTTLFLTTHYLEEAEKANQVVIIDKGEVVLQGTPASLKRKLVDAYLLVDSEDRKKLQKELEKMPVDFSGTGPFMVRSKKVSLQKVMQQLKTDLTLFQLHAPTLEEAYLKVIDTHTADTP